MNKVLNKNQKETMSKGPAIETDGQFVSANQTNNTASSKSKNKNKKIAIELAVIIIAGGNSSRLGQSKQLVELNGTNLLNHTLNLATQLGLPTACILGFDQQRMLDNTNGKAISSTSKKSTVKMLYNEKWQTGMGTSIAAGVRYFTQQSFPVNAIMVLLCDQYRLSKNDLRTLISCWQKNPKQIVASEYCERLGGHEISSQTSKTIGAPAIFPARYFDELMALTNKGARDILTREKQFLFKIPIQNAAFDLDTNKDLQELREFESSFTFEAMSS